VGEAGHVVAADRGEAKLALLRENLERLGANFTLVDLPEDPQRVNVGERFSHVLVDVPCSNTGVLARRPDARWRLRPKDIESLATLQAQLLEAAVRHLAPGGRLVYSTCSLEPEENEERTAALLAAHPDLVELEAKFLLPHRSGADGGYGVLLRRAVGQ
jgi:16S rRNA (cytosine967-C5)-methyltransferase